MAQRRIILVNRFFSPDQSATSRLLTDLASHLAQRGNSVLVVTTRGRYDDEQAVLPADDCIEGVKVFRVSRARFGRANLFGRVIDTIVIYLSFMRAVARLSAPGDVVVVKTDPPLLSVALAPVVAAKRLILINWLQDFYPEIALALGVNALKPAVPVLIAARNASLRAARINVVVAERMRDRLLRLKIEPTRIETIANWCDDEHVIPIAPQDNPLRAKWGLKGKFVVGYSGNLGRAHEFHTVLDAATLLQNEPQILFVFIGGGYLTPLLMREAERRGLTERFRFLPFQSPDALPCSLGLPDIHWLSMPAAMEGLLLPSKLYGIAAAGRPIVAIAEPKGEIGALIAQFDCGVAIEPNNHAALAQAIRAYRDAPALAARHGGNARRMLEQRFRKSAALDHWTRLIDSV